MPGMKRKMIFIATICTLLSLTTSAQVQTVPPEYSPFPPRSADAETMVIAYQPSQAMMAGCTYPGADNYDPLATEDDGSCIFGSSFCGPNTYWDPEAGQCLGTDSCLGDFDGDGLFTTTDLLGMLSSFGTVCP
jgi:hypothetical protein